MITIILIAVTCIISIAALSSEKLGFDRSKIPFISGIDPYSMTDKLLFRPYAVKRGGDFYRFVSSGFIHGNWLHLLFNMYVLYVFGQAVEFRYQYFFGVWGNLLFIILYFVGMIVADASTYFKHRDNAYYGGSLGASGAVASVLFAFILFQPTATLRLFFIPIDFPAVVLGIAYLLYSYYASRNVSDNINHDAHFYGALFGFSFTLMLKPSLLLLFIEQISGSL